ncbi:MAG: DUF11 domain-containing protein [Planctomycetes bacterium]|nr:DUF11 domain-containing protein [Planctomycetota bacterium]
MDSAFTTSGTFSTMTGSTNVDGIFFDPSGEFLFLSNRDPIDRLTILRRDGSLVQHVPMSEEPDGIAFHASTPRFVVTNNDTGGNMTRFDFPGDDFTRVPTQSVFASGGFRGDLTQVGPDGCLYLTQDRTRYDNGVVTSQNSLVRICGGFVPPFGVPQADLVLTKTDNPDPANEGSNLTYNLTVTNNGPDGTADTTVTDVLPGSVTFVSATPSQGSCTQSGGTVTCNLGPLARSGSATVAIVVQPTVTGTITNMASVFAHPADPNLDNNTATQDTTVVADFGDAPDSYGTLRASNGARHSAVGPLLGTVRDTAVNAPALLDGTGDDVTGSDDEDGVMVPSLVPGVSATATVEVSGGSARLDAWVDFDANGTFAASERITASGGTAVGAGTNLVTFAVPITAVPGPTFARFRLSTTGGLGSRGFAPDGEVEDYAVTILPLDFGDAPGTYGTLLANDGARHGSQGPVLGAARDNEPISPTTLDGTGVPFFHSTLALAGVNRIIAHGLCGNDDIHVLANLQIPAWLYGDSGNDDIDGGSGSDVLVGGDERDQITGRKGRDLIIGGRGNDSLISHNDEDILVAGTTRWEANDSALSAIMAEWTRADQRYALRVDHVLNGGGLNGAFLLNRTTVADDGDHDDLTGSVGTDLFFANIDGDGDPHKKDNNLDTKTGEVVIDINAP